MLLNIVLYAVYFDFGGVLGGGWVSYPPTDQKRLKTAYFAFSIILAISCSVFPSQR